MSNKKLNSVKKHSKTIDLNRYIRKIKSKKKQVSSVKKLNKIILCKKNDGTHSFPVYKIVNSVFSSR